MVTTLNALIFILFLTFTVIVDFDFRMQVDSWMKLVTVIDDKILFVPPTLLLDYY